MPKRRTTEQSRPWRVESHILDDGEPWTIRSTHATEAAANARRDELQAGSRMEWRVTNRDEVPA